MRYSEKEYAELMTRRPNTPKPPKVELAGTVAKAIEEAREIVIAEDAAGRGRVKRAKKVNPWLEELCNQIAMIELPTPDREVRYVAGRRWAADLAWPGFLVAGEAEGGIWGEGAAEGRHTRGAGYQNDCIKYNECALNGWLVVRFTEHMVTSGLALAQIERALLARGWRK